MKKVYLRHAVIASSVAIGLACAAAFGQSAQPSAAATAAADVPVTIQIDADTPGEAVNPFWRFFGYDEANFTTMKYGQKQLAELSQLGPQQVYIRCHHLMTSGDGTPALKWSSTGIYSEDAQGNPVYNYTIVDGIFDTYVKLGLKPYVEIGFMPKDLSTRPDLYPAKIDANTRVPTDAGQAYPPKDYGKWGELVHQWAAHCVQRYGEAEVNQWYWEVWNEPDISYWKGKPEDYYKLYDYAIDGVLRALPTARVGGPDAAGNDRFLRGFFEHCLHGTNYVTGKQGTPLKFVSFHAKGSPTIFNGHVRMGANRQLQVIDRNFAAIASFPELKNTPIVIGECDPEGLAARSAKESPANAYRFSTLFSSYEAEVFARTQELAAKHGVNLEGALTWSFEFENQPYFAGYRTLSTNGIDLPVCNVFRMFGKMAGKELPVKSSADLGETAVQTAGVRGPSDVFATASLDDKKLNVMVWNYTDDDTAGPGAAVEVALAGIPLGDGKATVTQYRIGQEESNSYTAWKNMGSPQPPSAEQSAQLEKAGQLATVGEPGAVDVQGGKATLKISLPRQAVSLLVLQWQ